MFPVICQVHFLNATVWCRFFLEKLKKKKKVIKKNCDDFKKEEIIDYCKVIEIIDQNSMMTWTGI